MLWINDITYTSLHFYVHDTLPFQTRSAEINLCNVLWDDPPWAGRLNQITHCGPFQPEPFWDCLIPFDSIWKFSLSDELHSLDRKTWCNKTLILSFFNNFLPGKKLLKNLAGMVDNQHSKHSNTFPNREAMLGQNLINSSKPSARRKQLT